MSLFGMMRTGSSGMNAQANRLSTVSENIANANTTGYKRASTEFSSLILPSSNGAYNSGGVETKVRYSISEQGPTTFTTSGTDMAINGGGFFIVSGENGSNFLTRAGAFVSDGDGNLVNSAGYTPMGYEYEEGVDPTVVVNGFDGLTQGQSFVRRPDRLWLHRGFHGCQPQLGGRSPRNGSVDHIAQRLRQPGECASA